VVTTPSGSRMSSTGGRSDQTIILTGGVRTPSDALGRRRRRVRSVHVDLVFVGHGMDPRSGSPARTSLEADTDRALIDAGRGYGRRPTIRSGGHRHQLDRASRPDRRAHHHTPGSAGGA
jgi:hypothetical protein